MRRFLILISIAFGLAAGACGGADVRPGGPFVAQATTVALQQTVDSLQAEARETALAWMTENAPVGTSQPQEVAEDSQPASIRGELDYPAAELPPVRVVAFNVDSHEYYSVEVKDEEIYLIDALPPGNYQVVAYLMAARGFREGQAGGYSQAVLCGLTEACQDHSLITLELEAGEMADEVNPGDWRAPEGSFPPDPTR